MWRFMETSKQTIQSKDFFEEFGLEVATSEISVGQHVPIFGMITNFIDDSPGHLRVLINFHITASMNIDDAVGIQTLKERLFEPGIFVSTVLAKEPKVEVLCQTVIFGKRQALNA
jgi:hypothetical protein